jgi:uncharacterized protein (TIGR03086 family)
VTVDLRDEHRRACAEFTRRLVHVGPADWRRPTPCDRWTVRDLVGHVVETHLRTARIVAGERGRDVAAAFDGWTLPDDAVATWEEASRGAIAAFASADLTVSIPMRLGRAPVAIAVSILMSDALVHAWDLARAIGADERLPEDLLETSVSNAGPFEAPLRESGFFRPRVEVADDADPLARALAFFGRRV